MCNQATQCYTSTTFFVWAGDNLLWEIKDTNGNGTAAPPPESSGTVSYFHAGGIDRPLVIWKNTVGSIVTHQNWRGQFARGTWGEGTGRVGQSSDCASWPQQNPCVPVPWPGWNTTAWHEDAAKPQTVGTETYWLGSLSVGMRDASGQMYMRNRYYNPQTGQFTQTDPIGLAGGLNSYGFAAGDPVTYSDPYGLSAQGCEPPGTCPLRGAAIGATLGAGVGVLAAGVCTASTGVCALGAPGIVGFFSAGGAAFGGLIGTVWEAVDEGGDGASADDGPRRGSRTRRPVGEIRGEWEEIHGTPWPREADGRNLDADHDEPLADGGADHGSNITPRTRTEHVQRHKDRGDFARWGSRSRTRPMSGPDPGSN